MPNWNPSFPEVLGNEFLITQGQHSRVWAGAPARMTRITSTTAEDIESLRLSATVDPFVRSSVPTLIDVIEEGNDYVPIFKSTILAPVADHTNEGWTTASGGSTNLYQQIDEDTLRWPGPSQNTWIQVTSPLTGYFCSVNASLFDTGGAAENGRIGWVAVNAIMGANTGFRKMNVALQIGGTAYAPAGGALRDVHGFGATYTFWWGEINPATGLPWTPADIAEFGAGGTSSIRLRSHQAATASHYPKVFAVGLNVHYSNTENREAVGVWRRPESIGTERLINVETDALISLPSGTPGWSKPTGINHLYYWRQSVSPSEYGATVADDVRWNGVYQNLGPRGIPAGIVYPLHHSGAKPPPANVLASDIMAHDQFGRPLSAFDGGTIGQQGSVYAIAPIRTLDGLPSVDSQPYRLDITDLAVVKSGQSAGQRVTMPSAQSYIGVRLPIIPPSTGTSTLSVGVYRVSDGVQMGGSYSISATAARRLTTDGTNIRYVTGFLSAAASLASATAYEIRLSVSGSGEWLAFMPDTSIAPTQSFNGSAGDGAFVGAVHDAERDLSVNLIRQPDPPTGVTATVTPYSVTMPDQSTRSVEHVNVSWTAPVTPLGAAFSRYELERQIIDPEAIDGFETGIGSWTSFSPDIVGEHDTTMSFLGASSFRLTRGTSPGWWETYSGPPGTQPRPLAVAPGEQVRTRVRVRHDSTIAQEIKLARFFYAGSVNIAGDFVLPGTVVPPNEWVEVEAWTTVPATADGTHIGVASHGPATVAVGESLWIDEAVIGDYDRSDAWTRIANLNAASLLTFQDRMVPRNMTAVYRIRQVAKDGRVSDWTYSIPAVPSEGDYDVVLTSNHTPELEVVMDAAPEAAYQFLSTEGEESVSLHGVDYQVVFTEVEDRGISWQAEVELNFGDEPPIVQSGQKLFTSLLDIIRSTDTPYVVAMDHQGTRILGHVKPTNATQQQPGNVYRATITVVPTHTEEVPVEVEP